MVMDSMGGNRGWREVPTVETGDKPYILKMPTNPEKVAGLRKKMEDYQVQLEQERKTKLNNFQAPEIQFDILAGTIYKIQVISRLIDGTTDTGSLNTQEFSRELMARDEMFNSAAFENACQEVKDYCEEVE